MRHFPWFVIFCLLTFSFVGCKKAGPPGMSKPYPVTITVKYDDGTVVDKASVIMIAKEPDKVGGLWSHSARTDEQGVVKMFSDGIYPGVPAGTYSVMVTKFAYEDGRAQGGTIMDREKFQAAVRSGKTPKQYSYISDEYSDEKTTPITVNVEKKTNTLEISVGSKVRVLKPERLP